MIVRYSEVNQAPEQEKILNKSSIFALGEPGVFLNQNLSDLSFEQLEDHMNASAVLLLSEMHNTDDLNRRTELFEQAADQEAALISEVLDGAVVTDFTFHTKDGRLYLLQPNGVTDWQKMHEHGVLRAEAKAAGDKRFEPYVGIAKAELGEANFQEKMVRDGKPAVISKLSLCGEDVLSAAQLEQLGRHPESQRAFLRVSVFDGKDMHIHSRSIDGLNLLNGRGIATGWGLWDEPHMELAADASSVDILDNQLYFDEQEMSLDKMHELADRLVGQFDKLQTERTGRLHKAGRVPEGVDTYRFVLDNQDLLDAHMSSLVDLAARAELPVGHLAAISNGLRYDIMSSFKQRLEGTWIEYGGLSESVARAGDIERTRGTQYGGCEVLITGAAVAERAGYVNAGELSRTERTKMVKNLRKEVRGTGSCEACGAKGKLFGCGLCGTCNKKWCDVFEKTGKQTPINKLAKYKTPEEAELNPISQHWGQLKREAELKKLKKEADLTGAA